MIEYRNTLLHSLADRGTVGTISDVRLIDCDIINCILSLTRDISGRTLVKHVEMISCREQACDIGPAILEDVYIRDLRTKDTLIFWGTLFRHVTITGHAGRIKVNRIISTVDLTPAEQLPFDQSRRAFYEQTDWALDIREAQFVAELDLEGIPSRLVRRDPSSQVVVTRERALNPAWRQNLSSSNTLWPFIVDKFLSDGDEDRVLITPLAAPKKKRDTLLKQLDELRESGVVIPE